MICCGQKQSASVESVGSHDAAFSCGRRLVRGVGFELMKTLPRSILPSREEFRVLSLYFRYPIEISVS